MSLQAVVFAQFSHRIGQPHQDQFFSPVCMNAQLVIVRGDGPKICPPISHWQARQEARDPVFRFGVFQLGQLAGPINEETTRRDDERDRQHIGELDGDLRQGNGRAQKSQENTE